MIRLTALLLATSASIATAGDIYKCKTDNGFEFSTKPCGKDAEAVKFKQDKPAKQASSSNDVGIENESCNVTGTYYTKAAGNVINRTSETKRATVKVSFYRAGTVIDTAQSSVTLGPWQKQSWDLIGGSYGSRPPDQCEYSVSWG